MVSIEEYEKKTLGTKSKKTQQEWYLHEQEAQAIWIY